MSLSIHAAIQEGRDALHEAGIADSRRLAGSLLVSVLNRDQIFLLAHRDEYLTGRELQDFRSFIARRLSGEPLQHITGFQEFYKLKFEVTPDVLIPRPETEAIVEIALGLLKDEAAPFIADIGTGSGCIAISFLKERPDARAVGSDISVAALAVAGRNARRYGVSDRLALLESDSFVKFIPSAQFSLIASNPPYVPEADWANLPREVRDHEPRTAFVSGADGLDSIRRLLPDSPTFLRAHGFLLFEIGFGQEETVRGLIEPSVWNLLEIRRDLQGIPRTVVLQKK
jgi:release factor glutamine methyltransferase